ncbi:PASTA domain-containing protein [Micromonospora coxensis]|uniref:PASTA domain-containing protein n=1 Tax=Micromonospora coxensis TaxID=356852 RepID=A0A1C5IRH0_9ACTN|nr:PASTA domain-containing protein [Micromonospora coxensis]SCG60914.1 PASTA domain-containing protein [Micromonospora coxensis]
MSDGHTLADGAENRRPGRASLVLGGALAFVLLASVGATVGWLLADPTSSGTTPPAASSVTVSPSRSTVPAPAPPTTTRPSAPRTTSPAPSRTSSGLTVPALVGTDFEKARDELRDRKLSWRLVFGTGSGRDVVRTDPAPGTPVTRGTTVQVYVAGPAPQVEVPDLVDDDCADVAEELGERGLYPRYPTGRAGTVTAQVPAAGATARWNDQVAVSCGAEQG